MATKKPAKKTAAPAKKAAAPAAKKPVSSNPLVAF